jgi:hypothetical protein
MALKDWKQYKKDYWINEEKDILKILEYTLRFDHSKTFEVRKTNFYYNDIGNLLTKTKTHSQALKFAKAYMKTH